MPTDHPLPEEWARTRAAGFIAVMTGLLAIGFRWYFVTHAQAFQPLDKPGYWGDAAEYYWYAWNLIHNHVFSQDIAGTLHPVADSYRDPGYPLFLALFMALTDSFEGWYASVLITHAFLGGITVACIVMALRDAVPSWVLALIGIGTALWPHGVSIAAYVFTENLTAPLWAIALLAVREAAARPSLPWTTVAGIALAAAGLTNAVLAPLALPLALVLVWKQLMPPRQILLILALALLPIGAWSARNATVATGQSSTHRVAMNLVQGSWPTYHLAAQLDARHVAEGTETMAAIYREIDAFDASRSGGLQVIWQRMSRAPGTYLAWYLSKPTILWGWQIGLGAGDIYVAPTRNSPYLTDPTWRRMEAVAFGLNGVIGLLALGGVAVTLVQRVPNIAIVVLTVTVLWISLVYGILQSDPRYSTPFRGAEIALACGFAVTASKYIRQRRSVDARGLRAAGTNRT